MSDNAVPSSRSTCSGGLGTSGCSTMNGTACASWCAISYIWLILFLIVLLAIFVLVGAIYIYPMNPSFLFGRYMCHKDAVIVPVEELNPFLPYYQPHNSYKLIKLLYNLGNESCVKDEHGEAMMLGRPDAQIIKIIRVRHAFISGWQPLCALIRLPELPDVIIICWNNFRALTLFRYMIQSGMTCPEELQKTGNIPMGAKYRTGIWSFYSSVRESVLYAFSEYKTQKLVICGHSLGGILGTAFAADVIAHKLLPSESIWLYTYGSPRCANRIFCQWLRQHVVYCAHVQMERDFCSHLPQAEWHSVEAGSCESYENVGQKLEFRHEDRGWHQNHSIDMYKTILEAEAPGSAARPESGKY